MNTPCASSLMLSRSMFHRLECVTIWRPEYTCTAIRPVVWTYCYFVLSIQKWWKLHWHEDTKLSEHSEESATWLVGLSMVLPWIFCDRIVESSYFYLSYSTLLFLHSADLKSPGDTGIVNASHYPTETHAIRLNTDPGLSGNYKDFSDHSAYWDWEKRPEKD